MFGEFEPENLFGDGEGPCEGDGGFQSCSVYSVLVQKGVDDAYESVQCQKVKEEENFVEGRANNNGGELKGSRSGKSWIWDISN